MSQVRLRRSPDGSRLAATRTALVLPAQRSMAGAHGPLLLCPHADGVRLVRARIHAGTEIAKRRRQNHRRQSSKAGLMSYIEPGRCVSVPVNTVPEFITHAKGNREPLRSRRSGAILSQEIP